LSDAELKVTNASLNTLRAVCAAAELLIPAPSAWVRLLIRVWLEDVSSGKSQSVPGAVLVDLSLGRLKRSCKNEEVAGLLAVRSRGTKEGAELDLVDLDLFLDLFNHSKTEDMANDCEQQCKGDAKLMIVDDTTKSYCAVTRRLYVNDSSWSLVLV
jgi:hypothetical protein